MQTSTQESAESGQRRTGTGRVEALSDGPYFELFAKQQWPSWTFVGDEVGKFQREATQ